MGVLLQRRSGLVLGESQIGRLMRKYCLNARTRQIRKARYVNRHVQTQGLAANVLNRQFAAQRPGEKLLTDVTYVPYYEAGQWHWGYLSLMLDLYDRSIVSWVYSRKQDQQLALNTLRLYSFKQGEQTGMLHSDHGTIYTSHAFRERLKQMGLTQSLSRVGNCHDNAPMECFNGILKVEGLYNEAFSQQQSPGFVQQNEVIERFIEFYNHRRPSSVLNNMTPMDFRHQFSAQCSVVN